MHLIVGVFALVCVFVIAPLWRRWKQRRANAKFQHSIWAYDETRRTRILAGADPRSIPYRRREPLRDGVRFSGAAYQTHPAAGPRRQSPAADAGREARAF